MNINKVNIYKISLSFTGDFSHSRKKGSSANNIIVEVIADKGKINGYGEGAPRLYVTGESQESVTKSINYFLQKDYTGIYHFPRNSHNDPCHSKK